MILFFSLSLFSFDPFPFSVGCSGGKRKRDLGFEEGFVMQLKGEDFNFEEDFLAYLEIYLGESCVSYGI